MKDPNLRRGARVGITPAAHADQQSEHALRGSRGALTIGAIGVVYGDIGTSPLYSIDQIFFGPAGVAPTPDNVLGAISLAIWTITIIVAVKYALLVLRVENDGEGGVFALYGLLHRYKRVQYAFSVDAPDAIPLEQPLNAGLAELFGLCWCRRQGPDIEKPVGSYIIGELEHLRIIAPELVVQAIAEPHPFLLEFFGKP
jgi:hypothetical protein